MSENWFIFWGRQERHHSRSFRYGRNECLRCELRASGRLLRGLRKRSLRPSRGEKAQANMPVVLRLLHETPQKSQIQGLRLHGCGEGSWRRSFMRATNNDSIRLNASLRNQLEFNFHIIIFPSHYRLIYFGFFEKKICGSWNIYLLRVQQKKKLNRNKIKHMKNMLYLAD